MQKPTNFWQAIRATHKRQHHLPSIEPRPRNGAIPLSVEQERLWAVDQLNPDSVVHNLRSVFRLDGPLEVNALTEALQIIIKRHETLRTIFPNVDGKPIQQIIPNNAVDLPIIEVSETDQEKELKRLAIEFGQQPFNLATGPLMRLKLLRLSETEHVLLRTIHHIISDRWSDTVFLKELANLYQAMVNHQEITLSPLPIQYADFALFQQQWLTEERLDTQQSYWEKQLVGDVQPAQLPISFNTTNNASYQGNTLYLELPAELTQSLKKLSQQTGVSLFVVILAAFKTLLYQYSGQEDIVVCSPVAGRHQTETKKLIGYFSKLMLLRTSLANNPTFQQLIHQVSQVTLGVFENQDIPIQQIAERFTLPSTILSRVMVALQNVPSPPTKMGEVTLTPLDIEEGISNFDLSLSLRKKGRQLIGILRYKTALFDQSRMEQFLANFQTLLETVTKQPAKQLSELPRFETIVETVNQVDIPYIPPQTTMEQTVSRIWQQVLQQNKISIQANFFEIGGRSLAMMQIASQLQENLKQTIPLVELFKRPTIKAMAAYLTQDTPAPVMKNMGQIRNRAQQQRKALKRRQRHYKKQRGRL